jgi:hypothetical protein
MTCDKQFDIRYGHWVVSGASHYYCNPRCMYAGEYGGSEVRKVQFSNEDVRLPEGEWSPPSL